MLTPIETHYNGYRFRSRLEARWAVFMDTLKVRYQYEPEGFKLDGDLYLPDFWLPELDCWIEIKGRRPGLNERRKVVKLALASKKSVFVFGPLGPVDWDGWTERPWVWADGLGMGFTHDRDVLTICPEGDPHTAHWAICETCGEQVLISCIGGPEFTCPVCWNVDTTDIFHPTLNAAYKVARRARFEHGEGDLGGQKLRVPRWSS